MTRHTTRHTAQWVKIGTVWHLFAQGRMVAQLIPNDGIWLSSIWHDPDDGWHAVDFLTAAEGKAQLMRWWETLCRIRAEAKPRTGSKHAHASDVILF